MIASNVAERGRMTDRRTEQDSVVTREMPLADQSERLLVILLVSDAALCLEASPDC